MDDLERIVSILAGRADLAADRADDAAGRADVRARDADRIIRWGVALILGAVLAMLLQGGILWSNMAALQAGQRAILEWIAEQP